MNKTRARELRKNLTDAERHLWSHLRLRQIAGHKFHRQQPLGDHIVDFVCLEKRLIVEVDRGQHSEQEDHDTKRDEWLKGQGFNILRLWNHQILRDIEAVKEKISIALQDQ